MTRQLASNLAAFVGRDLLARLIDDPEIPQQPVERCVRACLVEAELGEVHDLVAQDPAESKQQLQKRFARLLTSARHAGGDVTKISADHLSVLFATTADAQRWQEQASAADPLTRFRQSDGALRLVEIGGVLGRWELVLVPADDATAPQWQMPAEVKLPHDREIETLASLRRFVPPAAQSWSEAGRQSLVVVRPMTALAVEAVCDFEQLLHSLSRMLRAVQKALYRYEGSLIVAQLRGDRLRITGLFGAPPLPAERSVQRGLKAAVEIAAAAERMRVQTGLGLGMGPCFAGAVGATDRMGYIAAGPAVMRARELAGLELAEPVRCDGSLCDVVEDIRFSELTNAHGKAILTPDDPELHAEVTSGTYRAPSALAGRGEEIERIRDAVTSLREGRGTALLVEAPSGFGKTRLLSEVRLQARLAGLQVLSTAGDSTRGGLTAFRPVMSRLFTTDEAATAEERHAAVRQILADIAPDSGEMLRLLEPWLHLGTRPDTAELIVDREAQLASLSRLVEKLLLAFARLRPMVITVDRAEALDSASRELVLRLVRIGLANRSPLLVAVAIEPHTQDVFSAQLRGSVGRHQAAMQLGPLPPDAVATLISARLKIARKAVPPELIDLLHARSGGSPLFAEEYLRAVVETGGIRFSRDASGAKQLEGIELAEVNRLPESVDDLLRARVERLPATLQSTLTAASILFRGFSPDLLFHLLPDHTREDIAEALRELARRELLGVEFGSKPPRYYFRTSQLQVAARELVAEPRTMHERALDWYERRFGQPRVPTTLEPASIEGLGIGPYLEQVAEHARGAGAKREWIYRVMLVSRAAGAQEQTHLRQQIERALEILPDDVMLRFSLLLRLAETHGMAGDVARRDQALDAAGELLPKLSEEASRTYALSRAAAAHDAGRMEPALELIECSRSGEIELGCEARLLRSRILHALGRREEAEREAKGAVAVASHDRERIEAQAEIARLAAQRAAFAEAGEIALSAYRTAREARYLSIQPRLLTSAADSNLQLGDLDSARRQVQRAVELAQALGDRRSEIDALQTLAEIEAASGDLGRAMQRLEKALHSQEDSAPMQGAQRTLSLLGRVLFYLGLFDRARICLVQAKDEAAELQLPFLAAEAETRLVLLEHAVGDNTRAVELGRRLGATLNRLGDPSLRAHVLTSLGHAFAELDQFDEAAVAYASAQELRARTGQNTLLLETRAGSARLDLRRGAKQSALAKVEELLPELETVRLRAAEQPFRMHQTCYEVLDAVGDARAESLIVRAKRALDAMADAISDPSVRQSFLEAVPENRAIRYYARKTTQNPSVAGTENSS